MSLPFWIQLRPFVTFILCGAIYLFLFPHTINGDGGVRYGSLIHLLETGEWQSMHYSYIMPLFSAPLHYLGLLIKTPEWWAKRYNALLLLGFCAAIYQTVKNTAAPLRLILLILFGGTLAFSARDFYGDIFSMTFAATGIWFLTRDRFLPALIFFTFAGANTPATLFGIGLVCLTKSIEGKHLRYWLIPFGSVALMFLETRFQPGAWSGINVASHPSVLPYDGKPGFSYPLFFGVLSTLFSFGKGILFYSPGLFAFLVPWRRRLETRNERWILLAGVYALGSVLVYSRWWAWHSDWYWGPRFHLMTSILGSVGAWLLLTAPLSPETRHAFWKRSFNLLVVIYSVWVSAQGITFGFDHLEACNLNQNQYAFLCWYVPEFSPLWRAFVVAPFALGGKQIAFLVIHAAVLALITREQWRAWAQALKAEFGKITRELLPIQKWNW